MRISQLATPPLLCLALLPLGCGDDTPNQPRVEEPWIATPTAPEDLVVAIETIYDDTEHEAAERLEAYASLFATDFVFRFQLGDFLEGRTPESWGIVDEVAAADSLFNRKEILLVTVDIGFLDAVQPSPPIPEHPDWLEIFANDVNLRVLTGPDDGFVIAGGQALFYISEETGRWAIHEWRDLPSPQLIDAGTWGRLKAWLRGWQPS